MAGARGGRARARRQLPGLRRVHASGGGVGWGRGQEAGMEYGLGQSGPLLSAF